MTDIRYSSFLLDRKEGYCTLLWICIAYLHIKSCRVETLEFEYLSQIYINCTQIFLNVKLNIPNTHVYWQLNFLAHFFHKSLFEHSLMTTLAKKVFKPCCTHFLTVFSVPQKVGEFPPLGMLCSLYEKSRVMFMLKWKSKTLPIFSKILTFLNYPTIPFQPNSKWCTFPIQKVEHLMAVHFKRIIIMPCCNATSC